MDQQQEHIATLCAAGTVGIAATGFVLASQDSAGTHTSATVIRRWPTASSVRSPSPPRTPFIPRRAISQPGTSYERPVDETRASAASSGPGKRKLFEHRPDDSGRTDVTVSRGSSLNRAGVFRPRTSYARSTSERRDASTGSSWLKRISTVSSQAGSSPATSIHQADGSSMQGSLLRPSTSHHTMPNKLVKRSTSQRGLSYEQARGAIFRRPATSHQRSAALRGLEEQEVSTPLPQDLPSLPKRDIPADSVPSTWRPFFTSGPYRKRLSMPDVGDYASLRMISSSQGYPTLMLGSQLERDAFPNEGHAETEKQTNPTDLTTMSTGRHRIKRSLSSLQRISKRRFFTDPVTKVASDAAHGVISPAFRNSPISPISNISTFEVDLRNTSPAFNSSPPFVSIRHRFSFRKRESTAPSDPTTLSSDNDTRVFTDDDSMEFQSDTAYDSLPTRATASSHSAARPRKLDAIFNETPTPHLERQDLSLEHLMQQTDISDSVTDDHAESAAKAVNHGIGIHGIEQPKGDFIAAAPTSLTPVRSNSSVTEDVSATPVPVKPFVASDNTRRQAAPSSTTPAFLAQNSDQTSLSQAMLVEEEDAIDWSPKSGSELSAHTEIPVNLDRPAEEKRMSFDDDHGQAEFSNRSAESDKRVSIFDWSENQRLSDVSTGVEARPKTVHGKQAHDNTRSRSSGRKAPNQMHLRSQSVPNNRENQTEPVPLSLSKFGTWGLGHKPVSEEWSDDFEFDDDGPGEHSPVLPSSSTEGLHSEKRGSMRGVKVPQSIIDRQASVHVQFGQVQEFMMLVEELKRLRMRGSDLGILESSARQLWEDAESIINLATINDEDDEFGHIRPRSPTTSDIFGDEVSLVSRNGNTPTAHDESKRSSVAQRSVSTPATPPFGRPRGESLAQAKNFLQNIHQSRGGTDSSPHNAEEEPHRKLPFDTQDLKDLVVRSGVITRALKEIVRKTEGVSVSPTKTPPRTKDPAFSQIFNAPDTSPCPPFRKPGLPKSRSANSYLSSTFENNHTNSDVSTSFTLTAMV